MHHLHHDRDLILGLHELVGVVVEPRRHHGAGRGAERQDAALAEATALRVVARRHATGQRPAERGDLHVLAHRHRAVGRRGDEAVPRLAGHPHHGVAWIGPSGVVVAVGDAPAGAVGRQVEHGGLRIGRPGGELQDLLVLALDLGGLRLGQDQILAPARVALQAGHRDVGPHAFEAGMTVGAARRLVGGRRARGLVRGQRWRGEGEHGARDQETLAHLQSPPGVRTRCVFKSPVWRR